MGYLSCRADSSISTCRSISSISPSQTPRTHTKKKNKNRTQKEDQIKQEDHEIAGTARRIRHFSYRELESATNNFSDDSLLGRGSHGSVYKAVLRGASVAVKRPSRRLPFPPTRNEVENEIDILSLIHSPRLVNLIGFTPIPTPSSSSSKKERLLVVEFMPNGTLYDFLHSNPRPPGWSRRLRLALQTAKALLTLHSATPPVIHRDVKSANILIDRNFNARLADFGLALRLDDDNAAFPSSCRSTPPAGTLGYLDPCYVTPDNLSTKTDVFSFGILLLEIMSGRKAIDVAHSPPSVVEWAVPLLKRGKVASLYDPRISAPRDLAARRQLAVLAASCVRSCDERRPSMEAVVEQLKVLSKTLNVRAWNGLSVGNPCSMVETERTLLKLNLNGLNLGQDSSVRKEEKLAGIKAPTFTSSSSLKAVRPSRNGRRVFSDVEMKRGSRNLMELFARPNGDAIEFGGSRSAFISRARTVHLGRDYSDRGGMARLRRNQTVKGPPLESPSRFDSSENLNGRVLD